MRAAGVVLALAVLALLVSSALIWQSNQKLRLERERAEAQTRIARRLLYTSDLNVAQQAWEDGHLARARELLERQRPQGDDEDLRGFEWRYLWGLCRDASLHTFSGHTAAVTAVKFSPDGTILASAGRDGSVRLWDLAARRGIVTLEGHEAAVSALAFSSHSKILATMGHGYSTTSKRPETCGPIQGHRLHARR
jgi:WD40 repeat protein